MKKMDNAEKEKRQYRRRKQTRNPTQYVLKTTMRKKHK
jgi:hypothetical protein